MKKSATKLSLNKMTISNLNQSEMNEKIGGVASKKGGACGGNQTIICTLTGVTVCFTCSGCNIK